MPLSGKNEKMKIVTTDTDSNVVFATLPFEPSPDGEKQAKSISVSLNR
jgi:hypothetical protein